MANTGRIVDGINDVVRGFIKNTDIKDMETLIKHADGANLSMEHVQKYLQNIARTGNENQKVFQELGKIVENSDEIGAFSKGEKGIDRINSFFGKATTKGKNATNVGTGANIPKTIEEVKTGFQEKLARLQNTGHLTKPEKATVTRVGREADDINELGSTLDKLSSPNQQEEALKQIRGNWKNENLTLEQATAKIENAYRSSVDSLDISTTFGDTMSGYKVPQKAAGIATTSWLVSSLSSNKGRQSNAQLYNQQGGY